MNILTLDLSKRSTGWAIWAAGSDKARLGHWQLGSEFTSDGRTYCKLHQCLAELHQITPFEHLYFEEPLRPEMLQGHTNIDTLRVLTGLAAHACSFGEAYRLATIKAVNISSWRKDFIGRQKRGTKTATLKALVTERCRQLGHSPRKDDEADAFGILDYACTMRGIVPPWRADEVLRPPLGMVG
jgi:hypothetical protein